MRARWLVVIVLAALAGCAEGPPVPLYSAQAVTRGFGYSEQPLSQSEVRVAYAAPAVRANSYAQIERQRLRDERINLAYDLALWRAAELALAAGYPAFSVADRQNDVNVHNYTYYDEYWDPWGCPYSYRSCFGRPMYWPPDRWVDVAVRVSFVARFERENRPTNYNAQFVIDQAKARYGSATVSGYYASAPRTTASAAFSASK